MIILFIGDIMGKPGREAVRAMLQAMKKEFDVDVSIANVENAAGGFGVTPGLIDELCAMGINLLTTGNHVWDKKELIPAIDGDVRVLRPYNYPAGVPGRGYAVVTVEGHAKLAIVNAMGRVEMNTLDDPFRAMKTLLEGLRRQTPCALLDFHAEATSEKRAMGYYLDGLASAVIGTHTHVQTADEQILPGGTAYITDVGMTGGHDSVIGVKKEQAIQRFLTQMPARFEVATGDVRLSAVVIEVDDQTGKALRIQRIQRPCPPHA